SARSSPAGSGFIPPLSQCLQLAVQEWVSSKETTKGRLVQKLHVPRAIIRAARTTGIALNGYSGKQERASEVEATREDSGRLRFDSLPCHLARFREHDSIPLSASKSKLKIWRSEIPRFRVGKGPRVTRHMGLEDAMSFHALGEAAELWDALQ